MRTFVVDVPAGAKALRIDLDEVSGVLDIWATHGGPVIRSEDADETVISALGRKTLLLEGPSLKAGPLVHPDRAADRYRHGRFRALCLALGRAAAGVARTAGDGRGRRCPQAGHSGDRGRGHRKRRRLRHHARGRRPDLDELSRRRSRERRFGRKRAGGHRHDPRSPPAGPRAVPRTRAGLRQEDRPGPGRRSPAASTTSRCPRDIASRRSRWATRMPWRSATR